MSEGITPDIIEMRRTMNFLNKEQRLEANLRLAQEWKMSGMTQAMFAQEKNMTLNNLRYRIRYARERAPEQFMDPAPKNPEFVLVSEEYESFSDHKRTQDRTIEKPALQIQVSSISLQVNNQIDPSLLKTTLEVILSC